MSALESAHTYCAPDPIIYRILKYEKPLEQRISTNSHIFPKSNSRTHIRHPPTNGCVPLKQQIYKEKNKPCNYLCNWKRRILSIIKIAAHTEMLIPAAAAAISLMTRI